MIGPIPTAIFSSVDGLFPVPFSVRDCLVPRNVVEPIDGDVDELRSSGQLMLTYGRWNVDGDTRWEHTPEGWYYHPLADDPPNVAASACPPGTPGLPDEVIRVHALWAEADTLLGDKERDDHMFYALYGHGRYRHADVRNVHQHGECQTCELLAPGTPGAELIQKAYGAE